MSENLASLLDRIEEFLADQNNQSWAADTLTECLRYALAEISQAAGASCTVEDLDGATATTIAEAHLPALILGTAAYAAKNRSLDRMEKVSLGEGPQAGLSSWGDWAMARFDDRLKAIKLAAINNAASAPHSAVAWEEEPPMW